MRVFFGIPCADGMVDMRMSTSLNETIEAFRVAGIDCAVPPCPVQGGMGTAGGRNHLVACAMGATPRPTHLLQIDADTVWKSEDAVRLCKHGAEVPIIGANYPKKVLDWEAVKSLSADDACDPAKVREAVSRKKHPREEMGDRVTLGEYGARVEVNRLPTGFLLTELGVFETIRQRVGDRFLYWTDDGFYSWGWFQYRFSGLLLGEDFFFSGACRELGIPLHELCNAELGHVGKVVF
jgi:hypothetical protein